MSGKFLIPILSLALFLLGACTQAPPTLHYLPEDAIILAYGDSLTYGSGAGKGNTYPAVLEQLSGRKVINAGVPGEQSAQGLQRLPRLLERHRPQLLLLCHGGNDILRRTPHGKTRENLAMMIREARKRGIDVVLIGVPEFSLFSLESPPFYAELAAEFAVPIEAEILSELESDNDMKSDHIHLNAAGYQQMAEAIHRLLIKSGALE